MPNNKLRTGFTYLVAGAIIGTAIAAPAHADINVPTLSIDAGPLGTLDYTGAVDGYAYAMTGTGRDSAVGNKVAGTEIFNTFLNIYKPTGLFRFWIGIQPNNSYGMGLKPSPLSVTNLELGPIKAAFVKLVPNTHFQFSAGFLYSAEGYESSMDVYNPNILESAAYWVENSSGPGVAGTYSTGPLSVTVEYGDGWETGAWNFIQGYASYTFDAHNTLNLYGGSNLSKIPLSAKTDGFGGCPYGKCTVADYGANYVNSTVLGAYYSYTHGALNLTPEVQYAYAKRDLSLNLPKFTSALAVVLHGNYRINKQWSVGAFAQMFTSNGDQYWYIANNAAGFGVAATPTWQQGHLFVRGTLGLVHLTNETAYGETGTGRTQLSSVLETGIVF